MEHLLMALATAIGPIISQGGFFALGWVIAFIAVYFLFKRSDDYNVSREQKDKLHREDVQKLHDDIKNLQEKRIEEAEENKDDYMELTKTVLQALEKMGAKNDK